MKSFLFFLSGIFLAFIFGLDRLAGIAGYWYCNLLKALRTSFDNCSGLGAYSGNPDYDPIAIEKGYEVLVIVLIAIVINMYIYLIKSNK